MLSRIEDVLLRLLTPFCDLAWGHDRNMCTIYVQLGGFLLFIPAHIFICLELQQVSHQEDRTIEWTLPAFTA